MSIGISEEKFWSLTPRTIKPYQTAQRLKTEYENKMMHIQGMYMYQAVAVALSQSFSKDSKAEYPNEPIRIFPMTAEEKAEKAEKDRQEAIAYFNALARKFETEEGETDV